MKKTLREFIKEISSYKEELLDKEIFIVADNGLQMTPKIKFIPKDNLSFNLDSENIDKVIITY